MLGNYILGIDPGNNLGVSLIEVDFDLNIKSIHTKVFVLNKGVTDEDFIIVERNNYLSSILTDLLRTYTPVAIGCEDCFKSKFANAVIQLSQYLLTIRTTVYREFGKFPITIMPPKLVKSSIGATGSATKHDMYVAVKKIKELKDYVREDMTEHEIDAMAISYLTLLDFRNQKNIKNI